MALSDTAVRKAKPNKKSYTLSDTDGLSLHVAPEGYKNWHFRFTWLGVRCRISFGTYPEISLKEARQLRDDARSLVAKGIDPRIQRRKDRQSNNERATHTFNHVFLNWSAFRALTLKKGRQSTLSQIDRIFNKDILPWLGTLSIFDITRADILEVLRKIERRGALTTAEKCRTWLNQLFRYAMIETGLLVNPATDLDIVAVPKKPVKHNPWLRMQELPELIKTLHAYGGATQTKLGLTLLLLTGVRTGELRHATPDQFDLEQRLWFVPPENVKQLQQLSHENVAPYIVPLSRQAIEIVKYLLDEMHPAQRYLLAHRSDLNKTISENTLNGALRRMGYVDLLTGHGIRGTISTALNELGYPKPWIEAQLSHSDKDKVSAAYNHAEYIEQRRDMMQNWADRLDQWVEYGFQDVQPIQALQSVPTEPVTTSLPETEPELQKPAPSPPVKSVLTVITRNKERPQPMMTDIQREYAERLAIYEAPHNLPLPTFAKLVGKSRDQINRDIKAGRLLAISMGNRGQRLPDWQLDPVRQSLVWAVLEQVKDIDPWQIYHALTASHESTGKRAIDIVTLRNRQQIADALCTLLRSNDMSLRAVSNG